MFVVGDDSYGAHVAHVVGDVDAGELVFDDFVFEVSAAGFLVGVFGEFDGCGLAFGCGGGDDAVDVVLGVGCEFVEGGACFCDEGVDFGENCFLLVSAHYCFPDTEIGGGGSS